MAKFEPAYKHTLNFEGKKYTNHPLDRGKASRYGITNRVARDHGYIGDIKYMPLHFAKGVYELTYWSKPHLYLLDQKFANKLFDIGVNCGVRTAGKIFQRAINLLTLNSEIKVDGKIGLNTIGAYKKVCHYLLYKTIQGLQFSYYHRIIKFRPKQKIFFKSWVRRV